MFQGPLFIVGMPRSGTKLLRALLDQHPLVRIAQFETGFFPYWVRNWKRFGDLSDYSNFQRFYAEMLKVPYFLYCRRAGRLISCNTWYNLCEDYTPGHVFEALIRYNVKVPAGSKKIWGDKSPGYMKHMTLLKRHFPKAKFVHIIRDVRDYCLSINKAWGKNMLRAAQRWVDRVTIARQSAKDFAQDYYELRYEDLLEDPPHTIGHLCSFLEVPFEEDMLTLKHPPENIGDAKGRREILSTNRRKFLTKMKPRTLRRIERISWHMLLELDYPISAYSKIERIPGWKMRLYRLTDGFNLLRTNLRRSGLREALKFMYGFVKIGWGHPPDLD